MKFRNSRIVLVTILCVILIFIIASAKTIESPNVEERVIIEISPDLPLPIPIAITQIMTNSLKTVTPTQKILFTSTAEPAPTASVTSTIRQGDSEIIGYSVKGHPLEVYHFGNGNTERMIVAGIHGGYESNTVELADFLIDYLRENPDILPADKTLYILRVLNPDGLLEGEKPEGRANANGVDLNRNWDADWTAEWNTAGCWSSLPLTGGAYPLSEPETQALASFILTHHLDALISYHSAGLGIFSGGQPSSAKSILLAQLLSKVSGYHYPPIESTCRYTGQLIDWAANHGIAAVDVELSNHTDTDLDLNIKILSAFIK